MMGDTANTGSQITVPNNTFNNLEKRQRMQLSQTSFKFRL